MKQNYSHAPFRRTESSETNVLKNKLFLFIPVLFFSLIFLSGCGGIELDGRGIVTSLEVTRNETLWHVQAEIVRFSDTNNIPGQETELLTGQGATLSSAVKQLNEIEGAPLYLGHLRLFLLNQAILSHGKETDFSQLNDFFLQNKEIRLQTLLGVSSAPFGQTLSSDSIPDGNHGIDLSRQLRSSKHPVEICDFINRQKSCGPTPAFPRIDVYTSENRQLSYVGDAVCIVPAE